jgi:pre-mRNA-splicing factor ATP-dependent RNA helicase DHX16
VEKKPKEPQKEKQKPKEPQKEKRPASPIKSTKGKKIRKRDTEEKAKEWEILDATDDELSELEEEISDRERDLRERDEFEQRLKDQDMNKPMQPKKIDQESILRKRMAEDEKYKQELIPSLREKSRTKYLIEREKKQLELLAKEVADEELLFRQERLTKREIRSLERKKKLLELRLTQDSNVIYDGYALPDEYMTESGRIDKKKQESVLHTRYEEAVKETSDMQQWEDNQVINILKRLEKT